MKKHLSMLCFLGVLGFASAASAFAPEVCFTDLRSYQNVRQQLPTLLQTPVIFTVHESGLMFGGVKISPVNGRFLVQADAYSGLAGRVKESSTISRACVADGKLRVTFDSGDEDTLKLKENGISMRGFTFSKTTQAKYDEVVRRVNDRDRFLEMYGE